MRSPLFLLALAALALAACGPDTVRAPEGPGRGTQKPPPPPSVTCPAFEPAALPERLSGTGLFVDVETDEVNPCVKAFEPRFWLWTDGADKRRFVYLPDGAVIDDTKADAWELPAGARLWKEFSRNGVRIETRVMWRTSTGWLHGAYVWGDDGDAVLQDDGVTDARGTTHDVPESSACTMCHGEGAETRPLGFSALQLAHDLPGVTFTTLVDDGRIRDLPAPRIPGAEGGDALDVEVLGWLHVNCGSCHRDGGLMQDYPLRLALRGDEDTIADTGLMRTAVGQPAMGSPLEDVQTLLVPGSPAESLIYVRASTRDGAAGVQMPPLGTEFVDEAGLSSLNDWIVRLAR